MSSYYIHDGINKEGPFDKEELRAKVIKPTTLVWCAGMTDWTEARNVDELKGLFTEPPPLKMAAAEPPPIKRTATIVQPPKSKSYTGLWVAIGVLVPLLGVGLYLWVQDANMKRRGGALYTERVMTIEEIEQSDPARFLEASGTWNENFWGTRLKVHGVVKSSATVAKFKDLVIQVRYLSKTETVLKTDQFVLYEVVGPHQEVSFEWTLDRPDDCKKLGWDVVRAVPIR